MSDESDRSYTSDQALDRAARYYDRFSRVYDVLLSPRYYRPPREAGVEALALEAGQVVLNVPCGTGQNVDLFRDDVTTIDAEWAASRSAPHGYDAVFCDLGLSGFPSWQRVIDQLLTTIKPDGRFVVMDAICGSACRASASTTRSRVGTCSLPQGPSPARSTGMGETRDHRRARPVRGVPPAHLRRPHLGAGAAYR